MWRDFGGTAALLWTAEYEPWGAPGSGAGDDLAVGDQEPAVLGGPPAMPAGGQPGEVRRGGQPVVHGLLREGRVQHPFAPYPGLPPAGLAGGVKPVAAGGSDIGEAGDLRPGHQPPTSVR